MKQAAKCMYRVGTGWDIHSLVAGRQLVLGGVSIPSQLGCAGHSDGDALVHAVIDALLGACGLDDIGTYFPDTDPALEGIDSMILLSRTMEIIRKLGYSVVNADSTVILQKPKLSLYKKEIRKKLASALGIEDDCVNVKAKTAEHILGELGNGTAVECQVCVLLQKADKEQLNEK